MLRHERRVLVDCLGIGIALTMLTIAADVTGLLDHAEYFLYDLRARTCQFFTPPPSDKLVHLDIDDTALDALGALPWPRRRVAMLLDEIRIAGPKALEMDLLFSPAQPVQYQRKEDGTYEAIDNDAELAAAIARLGNVIVPATLAPVPRESARYSAIVEELRKDLEQNATTLSDRLRARGIEVKDHISDELFFPALRDAMMRSFAAMKPTTGLPFEKVRAALLPRTPIDVHPGVEYILHEQWEKYLTAQEYATRLSLPEPQGMRTYTEMQVQIAPVRQITAAAAGGAFADYPKFGSAAVRTLPLLVGEQHRVYPQMGLALACRMLDADMAHMRVESDALIIPRLAGQPDVRIPLAPPRKSTSGYTFSSLIDVPWFGTRDWETMYDWPAHKTSKQHVPLNDVWQASLAKEKVRKNLREMDEMILGVYWGIDPDDKRIKAYKAAPPSPDDFETRAQIARQLLDQEFVGYLDEYAKFTPTELATQTEKEKTFYESLKKLKQSLAINPPFIAEVQQMRKSLANRIGGKAALIGWTATAAIADFVPTSLHEKAPGVVVHGVICNGIMTGQLWSRLPWWSADLIAVVMGILTAFVVGYFSPVRGLLVALALTLVFALINGLVLFDLSNRIVGAAAPLTAVAVVWGMCTLTRIRVEQIERERITRRFSTYASPRLVDYVLEHPDVRFEGENREMSIVYTDLAGFTTLSEKLGEKIVPVLNELLGELVPVIEDEHDGTINKFLGDGIMFFFNAPKRHEDHASRAVSSVLAMHRKVADYNSKLRDRGLPELAMRAGIACGVVTVGDAGTEGRSDYTVLGDAANLGSRLEAANKYLGSNTLMNDRASQLLNGEFLLRPVGRIKVVGKDEAVMCFEPLARPKDATDDQRELANTSRAMVDAFIARDFEQSFRCADDIDARFGQSKIAMIYRSLSAQYLESPPPADFDGRIVLTEK